MLLLDVSKRGGGEAAGPSLYWSKYHGTEYGNLLFTRGLELTFLFSSCTQQYGLGLAMALPVVVVVVSLESCLSSIACFFLGSQEGNTHL